MNFSYQDIKMLKKYIFLLLLIGFITELNLNYPSDATYRHIKCN